MMMYGLTSIEVSQVVVPREAVTPRLTENVIVNSRRDVRSSCVCKRREQFAGSRLCKRVVKLGFSGLVSSRLRGKLGLEEE